MSTRRCTLALIAVTALLLASPPATAQSPAVDAPDDTTQQPTPEPTADPTPEPTADPTPDDTPEPAGDATPVPAPDPTGAGVDAQSGCVLTSAGLICPGQTSCVVTGTGVTCASNCIVTSAGLACPRGDVVDNPPGQVLPERAVSRRPKRQPAPDRRAERDVAGKRTPDRRVQGTGGPHPPTLPFTGTPVGLWLALGCSLLAGGVLLRRRSSTADAAVGVTGEPMPFAALPAPSPADTPSSRRAIVLPALAVVACGMLLRCLARRGLPGRRAA
jgi:hypothetical protein